MSNHTPHPNLASALSDALAAAESEGINRKTLYAAMGYTVGANSSTPKLSRMTLGKGSTPKIDAVAAFAVATGRPISYRLGKAVVTIEPCAK